MTTLTVNREWRNSRVQQTILTDQQGKVKLILSKAINQPRYGLKTIVIRSQQYLLDWSAVTKR